MRHTDWRLSPFIIANDNFFKQNIYLFYKHLKRFSPPLSAWHALCNNPFQRALPLAPGAAEMKTLIEFGNRIPSLIVTLLLSYAASIPTSR
jgi:hypothetical protein